MAAQDEYMELRSHGKKAPLVSNFENITWCVHQDSYSIPLTDLTIHVTDMLLHQTPPFIPSMFSSALVKP